VGRLLASLHPETEELAPLAAHMIVRLLNAGHDDVAYNLVQFLAENSAEESSRLVSAEFLEQLVRTNATVTKLLWFLKVCRCPKLLYSQSTHPEWRLPISSVHPIMMETLALAGEGGGVHAHPLSACYHHVQSCSVRSS
jgi:hypothetical protein